MSEWKEYQLKELTSKIGSGSTPKGGGNSYKDEGISLIRSQNILDYKFSINGLAYIDEVQANVLKNVSVEEHDILLNITGDSVARCCNAPKEFLPARVNQHVAIIRSNIKLLDNNFLKYSLIDSKEELLSLSEIGGTRNALTKGMLENFVIKLPSLPEQKAIASVLSALDNKIDLLHRQNKTLESMAETLFRQWFVEEAQDDWEEVTLSDVCHRITDGAHASPKSIDNGWAMASVKDMETWGINYDTCRRISKEDYDELVRADCKALKGDILIAKDGSYLKHVFLLEKDIDVVLLSSIAMLRPNGKYDPMLLTIFLKMNSTREEMENIVTGAVIPRIVLKDFRKFPIRLPPREYQTKALIQISPIFRKCWLNNSQIKKLENLRDTLLPKLMSGEVRVNYTPEEIKQ
ncbi:restriction endonuclease subunit S [Proteus mirabilis]|uniref:restriction endonuclease subunit S n=1 Tax=Proteus mirabilis TaxID=584 RepID=UPI001EF9D97E|nr:restriction endonuclease subunit S [Proteus mirabilis]MCL8621506.1 restriction endonuclease subunit S [Proteus mirabilis]ULK62922.1 restriction endonuclease subunit S [Proteus mirabilis]